MPGAGCRCCCSLNQSNQCLLAESEFESFVSTETFREAHAILYHEKYGLAAQRLNYGSSNASCWQWRREKKKKTDAIFVGGKKKRKNASDVLSTTFVVGAATVTLSWSRTELVPTTRSVCMQYAEIYFPSAQRSRDILHTVWFQFFFLLFP